MSELPESTEASTYADVQSEVNRHFGGSWEGFLKAVSNPADILFFVYGTHFDKDREKFEAWSKRQSIPEDWIPRFFMTLTEDGELKPQVDW